MIEWCWGVSVFYLQMPMTPQARRPPALPVVLLSSWPPWPRSSTSAWITIVLKLEYFSRKKCQENILWIIRKSILSNFNTYPLCPLSKMTLLSFASVINNITKRRENIPLSNIADWVLRCTRDFNPILLVFGYLKRWEVRLSVNPRIHTFLA